MPKASLKAVSSPSVDGFQAIIPGTSLTRAVASTTAQSSAFGANTTIVRLRSTTDCFVEFGSNPTATSASMFLPSGVTEYFGVVGGSKLAVIRSSADGTLYITEGSAG